MEFKEFCKKVNSKCIELQNIDKEVISDSEAFEAYATLNVMKLDSDGDYLRFISILNLLNSYVKQEGAKLNYHFKLFLERFLKLVIQNKFDGVRYNELKDDKGGFVIIQFGELQFSFHSVKLDVSEIEKITDESLLWDGVKKQVCALTIYEMCKSDELLTSNLTKLNGNLKDKLESIMLDFEEGYIDFNYDFNTLRMNDDEYELFSKRYDKFIKYNLPYPFYDIERQTLEYVYKTRDYDLENKKHDEYVQVSDTLEYALDDIAGESLYFPYNTKLSEDKIGHSHAHSFEEVINEMYNFPESFSIDDEDQEYYSKQELRYLFRVQNYLLSIGLKDNDKNKDRYFNEIRETHIGEFFHTVSDVALAAIESGSVNYIVRKYRKEFPRTLDYLVGKRLVLRNLDGVLKYQIEFTGLELKPYKEVKDLFKLDVLDDDLVEIQYFNIINRY